MLVSFRVRLRVSLRDQQGSISDSGFGLSAFAFSRLWKTANCRAEKPPKSMVLPPKPEEALQNPEQPPEILNAT